jgi:hypothetical protein
VRPLVAHALAGLGTLPDLAASPAERRVHVETATRMFREMGMEHWLGGAEAAAPN